MWKCKECGEEIEDNFDSCWNCTEESEDNFDDDWDSGLNQDGTVPKSPRESYSINGEVKQSEAINAYISTYETTRIIAKIVSFIGWVVVVISTLVVMVVLVKSSESHRGVNLLGLLPALSGIVSGLLLVISGQFTRATVDVADNTGEMLSLMRKRQRK